MKWKLQIRKKKILTIQNSEFLEREVKNVKRVEKRISIELGQLMERSRRSLHTETFPSPVLLLCTASIPLSKELWTVLYAHEAAFGKQVLIAFQWGGTP